MHNYILILFIGLAISCNRKATELPVQDLSINTTSSLNAVKYIDDRAIIAGGRQYDETAIYILDQNKGLSKSELPANISNKELYGMDISASGAIIAVGFDASVLVSHDSGSSWQFVQNGTWKNFQDIAFRDQDTAFIVSHLGFSAGAMATVNYQGAGSNVLQEERNFAIDEIDFVNTATGFLCGYGAIMKTIDGGHTWTFTTAKNDYFKSMSWKNELEGVAVGYAGSILKTVDGGASWETGRNGNNFLKKKIHFLSVEHNGNNTYVAVGEKGFVGISVDGGENWQEVKSFTDKDLKALDFKNENECAVVGENGALFLLKL